MKKTLTYEDFATQLTGDYQEAFGQLREYFNTCCFDSKTRDTCLGDMVELLLSAQNNETPVYQVVGEDMGAFCRETFRAAQPSFGRSLWMALASSARLAVFIAILSLYAAVVALICGDSILAGSLSGGLILLVTGGSMVFDMLLGLIQKWIWDRKKTADGKLTDMTFIRLPTKVLAIILIFLLPRQWWPIPTWLAIVLLLGYGGVILLANHVLHKNDSVETIPMPADYEKNKSWDNCICVLRKAAEETDADMTAEARRRFVRGALRRRTVLPWIVIGVAVALTVWSILQTLTGLYQEFLRFILYAQLWLCIGYLCLGDYALFWGRFRREFEALEADITDESLLRLGRLKNEG